MMQCPVCRSENPADAVFCVECGHDFSRQAESAHTPPPVPPTGSVNPSATIPNYMIPAVLVTVFCCLPFGIPAIIFASQVQTKMQMGDIEGATTASQKARLWSTIAFVTGLIVISIYFIAMIGSWRRLLKKLRYFPVLPLPRNGSIQPGFYP